MKKTATRPKHVEFTLKHIFYQVDVDGEGKRKAKKTKTKYFAGYVQKYAGDGNIMLKRSEENQAKTLFVCW